MSDDPARDGDWISIEQQLPLEAAPRASAVPPKPAPRDPWVERLMAAERRKAARTPMDSRRAAAPAARAETAPPAPAASSAAPASVEPDAAAERAERAAPRADNAGLPRDLLYAFTFALPRAVESSSLWDELKPGSLGRVRMRVRLEEGRVRSSRLLSPAHRAARLVHDKTLELLRRGQFALGRGGVRSGDVVLQVELTLSDGPSRSAVTLWNELPERTRAHFIKPSGRRLDAHVEMFD